MLRDLAGYVLGVIGKRIGLRGVILHSEVDAAISRLEAALDEDARIAQAHSATRPSTSRVEARADIGLKSRALPFLDMLRQASQHDADILWEP
jgi:hypothetical protein